MTAIKAVNIISKYDSADETVIKKDKCTFALTKYYDAKALPFSSPLILLTNSAMIEAGPAGRL